MRPPSANLLITRGEWRSINSDGGVGRDILSLLCGRRRVSGAGKFTGRHKTVGEFRDSPTTKTVGRFKALPAPKPAKRPAFNTVI